MAGRDFFGVMRGTRPAASRAVRLLATGATASSLSARDPMEVE
jgi:hypothetical protein